MYISELFLSEFGMVSVKILENCQVCCVYNKVHIIYRWPSIFNIIFMKIILAVRYVCIKKDKFVFNFRISDVGTKRYWSLSPNFGNISITRQSSGKVLVWCGDFTYVHVGLFSGNWNEKKFSNTLICYGVRVLF